MLLELLTLKERLPQSFHDLFLIGGQTIGVCRVYGGQIHVFHGIFLSADCHRLFFIIDLIQKKPVVHLKFGMSFNHLSFQLKLHNGNCLVDFHIHTQIFGIVICVVLDGKSIAVHIFIHVQGKGGKRDQVDPITVL